LPPVIVIQGDLYKHQHLQLQQLLIDRLDGDDDDGDDDG